MTVGERVCELVRLIESHRFPLESEKECQRQIYDFLLGSGVGCIAREYRLDDENIIDFLIEGVGVEVKLNGHYISLGIRN